MLDELILTNRQAILSRARQRAVASAAGALPDARTDRGIPLFLDQLGEALRTSRSKAAVDHADIATTAGQLGVDLFQGGATIADVVYAYGDVCQAITEMALEMGTGLSESEFHTLNLCLDEAIARAVTDYAGASERAFRLQAAERLGVLAHELRNLLHSAVLSFETMRTGTGAGGRAGLVHDRSLASMQDLVDRALTDVRLEAGLGHREVIAVWELLDEIEIAATIQARARGLFLSVSSVDHGLAIEADRQTVAAAIVNLLHNAFKFTRKRSMVALTTRAVDDRVLFEVEDECGGLPPGDAEELFRPFTRGGSDHSGIGLGLTMCMRAAEANGGQMRVRDLPGVGCIFTLDLPRANRRS